MAFLVETGERFLLGFIMLPSGEDHFLGFKVNRSHGSKNDFTICPTIHLIHSVHTSVSPDTKITHHQVQHKLDNHYFLFVKFVLFKGRHSERDNAPSMSSCLSKRALRMKPGKRGNIDDNKDYKG